MKPIIYILENQDETYTVMFYDNEASAERGAYSCFRHFTDRESAEAGVKRLGYPVIKWQLTRTSDGREWHAIYA